MNCYKVVVVRFWSDKTGHVNRTRIVYFEKNNLTFQQQLGKIFGEYDPKNFIASITLIPPGLYESAQEREYGKYC